MKKTAIIFPGQGSQYIGMGKEFLEADADAVALMEMAEEVSDFPLRRLCLDGPMEELTKVLHLQPALFSVFQRETGLIAVERLFPLVSSCGLILFDVSGN